MNRKQFVHFSLTPMDTYVTVRFFTEFFSGLGLLRSNIFSAFLSIISYKRCWFFDSIFLCFSEGEFRTSDLDGWRIIVI